MSRVSSFHQHLHTNLVSGVPPIHYFISVPTLIYQDTLPAQCLFVLLSTCISRLCFLIRGCQSLLRACHLHLLKRVRWACHLHLLKIVRWACHLHLLKRVRWGCHLHLANRVRWGCHLHVVAHPILSLKGRWWPPPSYFKG